MQFTYQGQKFAASLFDSVERRGELGEKYQKTRFYFYVCWAKRLYASRYSWEKKTEFAYPETVFWKHFCRGLYTLVNNINPGLMKQIFQLEETRKLVWKQYKPHLSVSKFNQISCGEESQSYYVPKILISLLFHGKTRESLKTFRDIIKNWNGSTCNCRVCQSWAELILSLNFFLLVQHLWILYTSHIKF